MLTFKYFYIMADDLNLIWKTILSLYNTYPSGNNTVRFWHKEDIYVSFTLHISEFICCLQWEYVTTAKVIPYKIFLFKCANTVMIFF